MLCTRAPRSIVLLPTLCVCADQRGVCAADDRVSARAWPWSIPPQHERGCHRPGPPFGRIRSAYHGSRHPRDQVTYILCLVLKRSGNLCLRIRSNRGLEGNSWTVPSRVIYRATYFNLLCFIDSRAFWEALVRTLAIVRSSLTFPYSSHVCFFDISCTSFAIFLVSPLLLCEVSCAGYTPRAWDPSSLQSIVFIFLYRVESFV